MENENYNFTVKELSIIPELQSSLVTIDEKDGLRWQFTFNEPRGDIACIRWDDPHDSRSTWQTTLYQGEILANHSKITALINLATYTRRIWIDMSKTDRASATVINNLGKE